MPIASDLQLTAICKPFIFIGITNYTAVCMKANNVASCCLPVIKVFFIRYLDTKINNTDAKGLKTSIEFILKIAEKILTFRVRRFDETHIDR